jgi:hypothetical protein
VIIALAKRWLLFAIGIPLVAYVLDRLATTIEERKGETAVQDRSASAASSGMHGVAGKIREFRQRRRR